MKPFTRVDYCQYLLSSPMNYTLTNLAEHLNGVSHDRIKRYLQGVKLTPRLLWEQVQVDLIDSPRGYLVFDDTVLDKSYSRKIEGSQWQYSGNAGGLVNGIGLVSCVYVNPDSEQYWVIDYRLYDKKTDGSSKLDHVLDMLKSAFYSKELSFSTVLMDSWYATQTLMAFIDSELGKIYYCPLKRNRQVDDNGMTSPYRRVDALEWSEEELEQGKLIKIRNFPAQKKVKLFQVTVSPHRTEYVATNDHSQDSTEGTQDECALRWKIEQFHRELKQLTGVEACQCRKGRIQRNHIHCALQVWNFLRRQALRFRTTVYDIARQPWSHFLRQQLQSPSLQFHFA
ncbi:MAG: transposase [Cyanobacteria bacterium P01_H01_bin.15]